MPVFTPGLYGVGHDTGAPQSGETGGDDGGMAKLRELLKLLEEPVPDPYRASVGRRVMSGLAAGLHSAASIITGHGPTERTGQEQIDYEEAQSRQSSEGAAQRNQATRRGLIAGEFARQQGEAEQRRREEAISRRQEDQQRAIESRQKQLDEQNAQQADHASALSDYSKTIEEFPDFAVPAGEDLNKLTMPRLLELKSAYFKQRGADKGDASAMAVMHSFLQSGGGEVKSVTAPIPGGGSITAGKQEEAKPALENAPLGETTARQMGTAGVQARPGMTELEGQNALAMAKKEQEAVREKRLTQRTDRGNPVKKEILTLSKLRRDVDALLDMQMASGESIGGPLAGLPGSQAVLYLRDATTGSDTLAKRVAYNQRLSEALRPILFGDAGKNLTAIELGIMKDSAPPNMIMYPEKIQLQFLTRMKEMAVQGVMDRVKLYNLDREDVDKLLYDDYVPSELPPGATLDPISSSEAN